MPDMTKEALAELINELDKGEASVKSEDWIDIADVEKMLRKTEQDR